MLLGRISPMATFGQIGREMERLFGDFWPEADMPRAHVFPPLSAWEDGDVFQVEAEVPGVTLENIEIEVLGNEVTIKGRREVERKDNSGNVLRQERGHGTFTRVLTLPADVNPDTVEASLRNGVLTITLPKAETAKARKIEIRQAE